MDDMVRIGDASRMLGVTVKTVRRWDKAGKIEVFRTQGGHRRIAMSELEKLKSRKKEQK